METFGVIKSKILKKLTESYISKNKSDIKEIINIIKSDKEFRDLYLFYEDIENKYFEDPETARLYVEEVNNMLKNKKPLLEETCNKLNLKLETVSVEENKFYDALDQLLSFDSLNNLDKKVMAKRKIIEVITTKKPESFQESVEHTKNESLLYAVLTNDFNTYYDEALNEDEKAELKRILSIKPEELETEMNVLREELMTKINSILAESDQSKREELVDKLEQVKSEVKNSNTTKYNYYKLKTLIGEL